MSTDIYEILAAYTDAAGKPEGTKLEDWVKRYPEHEQALVDYALYSFVCEQGTPYVTQSDDEAAASFLRRAAAVRERLMAARSRPVLAGLLAAARDRGLSARALAERLKLGTTAVLKLDQRLFRPSTLPRELVARLAEELDRPFADLAAYLRQPPRLAAQVQYRAKEMPRVAEPEEFASAIETCRDMTAEQREHWRSRLGDVIGEEG